MDGNRDDAERCLQLAAAALRANDIPKADRLLAKSRRMYPLPDQQSRFAAVLQLHTASTSAPSSSTARPENEKNDQQPPRQPTAAMLSSVRTVQKLRHKSHYEILGISRDAEQSDIKRAYRKLALRLHPDRNCAPGSDDAFKRVGQAFVVLSDPHRRKHYDDFGTDGPEHHPVRRRRRKTHAAAAAGRRGQSFDDFDFATSELSAEDLFEFLFRAAARGGEGFAEQGFGPEAFGAQSFEEFDDGERESRRGFREYRAEEPSFWERFRPVILMFVIIVMAVVLAQDGTQQQYYSLVRTTYYSRPGVTRNDVMYFTAPSLDLSKTTLKRRLERSVDLAALEEYSGRCKRELLQEDFLLRQSRRWLIGRKEKQMYREKYEQFDKPWCGKARQLSEQLQRETAY